MCVLGCLFIFFASSIHEDAIVSYTEIFTACKTGNRTYELYETSQVLQSLRRDPTCTSLYSVEACSGYERTEASMYLKEMESQHKCHGFCYDPSAILASPGLPRPNATAASLYSQTATEYRASCDGVAARNIDAVVGGASKNLQYAGILFIIISCILIGLRSIDKCCPFGEEDTDVENTPAAAMLPATQQPGAHAYYGSTSSVHAAPQPRA
jgi:hypothetical protein